MNSKHNKFRVLGQRSIPSTFLVRSSNLAKDSKDDAQKKDLTKSLSFSFSDFLDQKVHTNPVLPKIVKGKLKPFRSPLGPSDNDSSIDPGIGTKNEEKEGKCAIDQVVFEQFKQTAAVKGDVIESGHGSGPSGGDDVEKGNSSTSLGIVPPRVGDIGTSSSNKEQEIRKRRRPFEDGDPRRDTRKHLLVLGDDTQPKQKRRGNRFISNKKPRPLYNHYGNGCGWWDCDMEGIDTEEVGYGEIWEGVGSTTLGGMEWH